MNNKIISIYGLDKRTEMRLQKMVGTYHKIGVKGKQAIRMAMAHLMIDLRREGNESQCYKLNKVLYRFRDRYFDKNHY